MPSPPHARRMHETSRAILYLLSVGARPDDILRAHPCLAPEDIQAAAGEALAALEAGESREARVQRVRARHPHAFEPWTRIEDAQLAEEFHHGASVAALSRAFGRPPGAVRIRLHRLGIDPRRRAPRGRDA